MAPSELWQDVHPKVSVLSHVGYASLIDLFVRDFLMVSRRRTVSAFRMSCEEVVFNYVQFIGLTCSSFPPQENPIDRSIRLSSHSFRIKQLRRHRRTFQ